MSQAPADNDRRQPTVVAIFNCIGFGVTMLAIFALAFAAHWASHFLLLAIDT